MKNKIAFLISVLLLSGCVTTKYSCTGDNKTGCYSLSEVANRGETPVAIEANNHDVISRKVALKRTAEKLQQMPLQGITRVNVGQPILNPPKTMRIFYTPYKDEQGDLNIGGYVYVLLNEPEWVIAQ